MRDDRAAAHGMCVSICNWVKRQMEQVQPAFSAFNADSLARGYACLGYQTALLDPDSAGASGG